MEKDFLQDLQQKASQAWDTIKSWSVKTATTAMIAFGLSGQAPSPTSEHSAHAPSTETPASHPSPEKDIKEVTFSDKEIISRLAEQDSQQYVALQGKYMHELLDKIMTRKAEYNQELEKFNTLSNQYKEESGYTKAFAPILEKYQNGEITLDETIAIRNQLESKYKVDQYNASINNTGEDPQTYAANLCGLGEQANYCIAIQTQAMRLTEKEMGNSDLSQIRENMGWTCTYATDTFQKNGHGETHKITSLYTTDDKGRHIVKNDSEGKPLVKDGDIALLDYGGKSQFGHCVRLNVDENGVLTYSAGNEDRNHAPISKLAKLSATVVSVQDYATELAQKRYENMSHEELLAEVQKREASLSSTQEQHATASNKEQTTADKSQIAQQLKRDAAHMLKGNLPYSFPQNYVEWAKEKNAQFNQCLEQRASDKNNIKSSEQKKDTQSLYTSYILNSNRRTH